MGRARIALPAAVVAGLLASACCCAGAPLVSSVSRAGRACMFEGGQSQMLLSAATNHTADLTAISMAYWFRPEVPSHDIYSIFSYGLWTGDFTTAVREASTGEQAFLYVHNIDDPVLWSSPFVGPGNKWAHVAATWSTANNGTGTIYVNGQPRGTLALGSKALRGGQQFWFPDYKYGSKFFGLADDLAAWSVALTPAEVLAVYNGNTRVRAESMLVHWECDEEAAAGAVDSAQPAKPSEVLGAPVPRVPSRCPNVDAGLTVLAVDPAQPTTINFDAERTLAKAADSGSLSVAVGAKFTQLVFTPPATGFAKATFSTSLGTVVVVPNVAPAPVEQHGSVAVGDDIIVSAAYWRLAADGTQRLYTSDAEGFPLTATVDVPPAVGRLTQLDGTPITAGKTAITDANLRVRFWATDDAYHARNNIGISFSVADEITATSKTAFLDVLPPNRPPQPVACSATVAQDAGSGVAVDLALTLDPDGSSTIIVSDPPRHGHLVDANGRNVTMAHTVYMTEQWVSSVVNASENESYYGGTAGEYTSLMVIGPPDVYPHGHDAPLAWTPTGKVKHWVQVRWDDAVDVSSITVYEVSYPDSVVQIDLLDAITGQWVTVNQRPHRTTPTAVNGTQAYTPWLYTGFYPIRSREARVWTQADVDADEWPAIDAIKLTGYTPVYAARVPGRRVTYVPDAGYSGPDSFTFQADMLGPAEMTMMSRMAWYQSADPATVSLTVTPSGAPVARASAPTVFLVFSDEAEIALNASSPSGSALTYRLVSAPASGRLYADPAAVKGRSQLGTGAQLSAGRVYYEHQCSETGLFADAFEYQAVDSAGRASQAARVAVTYVCAMPGEDNHTKAVHGLIAALVVTDVVFLAVIVGLAAYVFVIKRRSFGASKGESGRSVQLQ
eukprot:m51a1_g8772 hypothetical protein (896) ;mRNA; f:167182-170119